MDSKTVVVNKLGGGEELTHQYKRLANPWYLKLEPATPTQNLPFVWWWNRIR